ncbi:hypothetical protein, partial [Hyunsoonleella pacifica]|uniref:hypothetical protein n=2 Tax=Hyunsoonleella pacifica TaxID=1080224 RepID=UPI001E316412
MKRKLSFQNPKSILLSFFAFLLFSLNLSANTNCGHITGLEFSNGHEVVSLENNGVYNINDLPEHFYINLNVDGYSESAKYTVVNLETHQSYNIIENILPYTFPAGNGSWHLGTGTFEIMANLYKFDHAFGFKCDTIKVVITIGEDHEPICTADAGTFSSISASTGGGTGSIEAIPNDNVVVPEGYSKIFVLTSGDDLVIEQVNATPNFTVQEGGKYTVHTLVYDGRPDSANFLDLGVVTFGETTGGDVLALLAANNLCAALDVTGISATLGFCTADAGTLTADADTVTLTGDSVTISATPDGNIVVPDYYSQIFVLTSGDNLVIEAVDSAPSFAVTAPGKYTI